MSSHYFLCIVKFSKCVLYLSFYTLFCFVVVVLRYQLYSQGWTWTTDLPASTPRIWKSQSVIPHWVYLLNIYRIWPSAISNHWFLICVFKDSVFWMLEFAVVNFLNCRILSKFPTISFKFSIYFHLWKYSNDH